MKYGNLNFLEPSGPLQACNGTAIFACFCTSVAKRWPALRAETCRKLCNIHSAMLCWQRRKYSCKTAVTHKTQDDAVQHHSHPNPSHPNANVNFTFSSETIFCYFKVFYVRIIRFVDRTSLYNLVYRTNLVHKFS